ncbi:hypothetical protein BVX98_04590, partial [bacterium F11]
WGPSLAPGAGNGRTGEQIKAHPPVCLLLMMADNKYNSKLGPKLGHKLENLNLKMVDRCW